MRVLFLFGLWLIFTPCISFGQKKIIDSNAVRSWTTIQNASARISNDGKYLLYFFGSQKKAKSLCVKRTDNSWEKVFTGADQASFTQDSQFVVWQTKQSDSLKILDLKAKGLKGIANANGFLLASKGNSSILVVKRDSGNKLITVLNLSSSFSKNFEDVEDFKLNASADVLVMNISKNAGDLGFQTIWYDTYSHQIHVINRGPKAIGMTFSDDDHALAFLTKQNGSATGNSVRYYSPEMDTSKIALDRSELTKKNLNPAVISRYSHLPGRIIVYVNQFLQSPTINSNLQIQYTLSANNQNPVGRNDGLYCINIGSVSDKLVQLGNTYSSFGTFSNILYLNELSHSYLLFKSRENLPLHKLESGKSNLYMISMKDGSRRLIKRECNLNDFKFSEDGKWILWHDAIDGNWYSYDVSNNSAKCLTCHIDAHFNKPLDGEGEKDPYGIARFDDNNQVVWIYDKYDIWSLRLNGKNNPVSLTQGLGKRLNVQFRYFDTTSESTNFPQPIKSKVNSTILLYGFDLSKKTNCFYHLNYPNPLSLKKLSGGSLVFDCYSFTPSTNILGIAEMMKPLKARDSCIYLFQQMNTASFPNLYTTVNFKDFKPMTKMAPQKDYRWYKTELVKFSMVKNKDAEGVLYKPENMNPNKKYPLIFYYYEDCPGLLNIYVNPDFSSGIMNIPWFVSRGYLVFVPDIHYQTGHAGECALKTVLAAAKELSRRSYVDAKNLGLQGHSFGGFETNYIVTHSTIFKAAAISAGLSNLISDYNRNFQKQNYHQFSQSRIGANLFQKPQLYLENSPIFRANRVKTPLLLLYGPDDPLVPFNQGIELFNALSFSGKKAWLLSYKGQGHTLNEGPSKAQEDHDKIDYTIRLQQFFDHYLKHAPPPLWMTQGVKGDGGFVPDMNAAKSF